MHRPRRRDLPTGSATGSGRRGPWLSPAVLPALLAALLLSGCAMFERSDRAPARPRPGLENLPDPVVRSEPRSRWGNDDYTEGARTYRILPTGAGYDRVGVASWYGLKFHGRRTSSGEPYDMYRLSAAHRTLPIPAYARVRNLDNGRETVVRINDRGPFHGARFLDLSYAAAVKLGFAERGTARVRVTVLTAAMRPEERPEAPPGGHARGVSAAGASNRQSGPAGSGYFLQAGAFSDRRWADARVVTLRNLFDEERAAAVRTHRDPVDRLYRVRIGPLATRAAARRLQALFADIAPADQSLPVIVEE